MRAQPLALLVAAVFALPGAGATQNLDSALEDLRAGRYDEALASLRALSQDPGAPPEAARRYAQALAEVGRYEEALRALKGNGDRAASPELENVLGEILLTTGDWARAESAFRRAVDEGATDRNVARKNLGLLLWNRGEREEALGIFDSFIDLYNRSAGGLGMEELLAVGEAVRHLGVTNPALFQDALMAFDEAAAADPEALEPSLLAGELFLEKYRATDAREALREVLDRNPRHPRALLDLARVLDFERVGGAVEAVRSALETNARYPDAWAFLAQLHLETWDYDAAREEAGLALETDPSHLGALSVLASALFLSGSTEEFRGVRDRIHALNPTYPDLYIVMAENAAAQHQYATAVSLAGQALAMDSTSWRALGVLGMNQLRTGEVEEARANLERAFQGDPYNPWYKNTLDLLDTFVHYTRIETRHFQIYIHEREADLLGPYAAEVAEAAYAGLQARYGAEPPTPIRLEIYPSHADFSVRTLGITGLGALGVSFGSTLVMDSPSAREPGEFNWSSTLWHEVAHAFHLGMTGHRVPRWFTEGLAVHEQKIARSDWGLRPTPGWLQAFQAGQLHPVSRLNEGFVRPDYPEQVAFSYVQASLVLDLIEDRYGSRAVLEMMEGYRDGKTDAQVFREVLDESPEELDATFDAYIRTLWGARIAAVAMPPQGEGQGGPAHGLPLDENALRRQLQDRPESFPLRLTLGQALFRAGRLDEAEVELGEALRLFPEYGGPDSPYFYLARIHRERGEKERAARALNQLGARNEALVEIHLEEAEIWLETGEREAAARALERAVEIAPMRVAPHETLAALYEETGDTSGAVRERRAILALDPADRADAYYRLARALAEAGELAEARTQVLRALEIAPTFEDALELLLELRERIG